MFFFAYNTQASAQTLTITNGSYFLQLTSMIAAFLFLGLLF